MEKNTKVILGEGSTVTITNLTLNNFELFNYVKKSENFENSIEKALEVGAITLNRVSSSIDIDFITKKTSDSFNNLEQSIIKYVQKTIDPTEVHSVTRKIVDIFKLQNSQVRDLLKQGDSTIGALDKKINSFKDALEEALKNSIGKVLSDNTGLGLLLKC